MPSVLYNGMLHSLVPFTAKGLVVKNEKGEKNTIQVYQCPQVTKPVAVRYGMKNWSVATVFNSSGIPISPFRSDDWK